MTPLNHTLTDVEAASAASSSSSSCHPHQLPKLTDDDNYVDVLQQYKAQALIPLKEDLAGWLNTILGETSHYISNTTTGIILSCEPAVSEIYLSIPLRDAPGKYAICLDRH